VCSVCGQHFSVCRFEFFGKIVLINLCRHLEFKIIKLNGVLWTLVGQTKLKTVFLKFVENFPFDRKTNLDFEAILYRVETQMAENVIQASTQRFAYKRV
jgi:hypothetical protein